jgi:HK97 family phage prohead protease
MNRAQILSIEGGLARRMVATEPVEFRAVEDGSLRFAGYASVTNYSYTVYGGPPYGWNETIARGAFKKTLAEDADVNFLVNHEGISLARTKSGTLTLLEDKVGLRALADLDAENPDVIRLRSAISRGDVDEMSFGFRVTRDEWFDEEGNQSNSAVGTERKITEINLNKGDVSAVNYGANDATSGAFRDIDRALAELRCGHALTDEQRALVRSLAEAIDETTPAEPKIPNTIAARLRELEVV